MYSLPLFVALLAAVAISVSATGLNTFNVLPVTPGFPEGISIHKGKIFVSGPARFGTAGTGPGTVTVLDKKGNLVTVIEIQGEALEFEHAISNSAVDGDGRVYVISTQLGVLRLTHDKNTKTWSQESYGAPVPDLPPCAVGATVDCQPTPFDTPPLGNDLIFDADGYLYLTDSLQATVFRYAPGGGAPTVFFQSELFNGGGDVPFGTNGLRFNPERTAIYIAVTTSLVDPNFGAIYKLAVNTNDHSVLPTATDLTLFHTYTGTLPDQIAVARCGDLYVTLAGSSTVSHLDTTGAEVETFASDPSDETPLDMPAGIAFQKKNLLIANHALFSGQNFAVLKLKVNVKRDKLEAPKNL
eukprot:TRINITY_DN5998_c0_g1_i1.p1 TRINITY_DN5998_c0_g1~~TRINITY_DN5998_c0_g1_i1.p1  ORF type:complete len:355 (+),score=100.55 TRINITY_DN5998_c0_g1_i1:211-1275(+)